MARILIVEDQKIMQKYFEFIILQDPDLKLVDTISDAREAVKICNYSVIDLVLMDVQTFHNHDGLSAGKAIREKHPGTKVLIATSLIDLGDRFRLIINDVECKKTEKPMPKLPVGSAFWTPQPDLATGAEAWILAGGAHHTAFSYDLTAEQMGDWAAAMGIEAVYIDKDTTIRNFKNELRWNELAFRK